ncbi:Nadph oxidase, partial [Operophtera brumata]
LGLCLSRSTATILNVCGAFILLPQCKKLNQILYRILSKLWPGLFFFWLERAKSFHMTVATTLVIFAVPNFVHGFAVLHSVSHFVNLWNFSRGFDEECLAVNFANYRNENPLNLLLSMTCITGLLMLLMTLLMGVTSLRFIRRRVYNAFWYAHQLYLPFMVLFLIHPLSLNTSHIDSWTSDNATANTPRFTAIESKTWLWMSVPLTCFFIDLLWRIFSRNRAVVDILEARHMAGRTISLKLSYPCEQTVYRSGQYVVLQCPQVSLLEWHPFTVVKVPTSYQRSVVVWIRVKGDWTEALEKLLKERGPRGIKIHLLWIVRHEQELTWLAELADRTLTQLRSANRPDRLHLQLYVTNTQHDTNKQHFIVINEKGRLTHLLNHEDDEKAMLLTPNLNRNNGRVNENYDIAKEYPLLGCRVMRGRPHWDRVFGYWISLKLILLWTKETSKVITKQM